MRLLSNTTLLETFKLYQSELQKGQDAFGKTDFPGFPAKDDFDWEYEIFHVGFVLRMQPWGGASLTNMTLLETFKLYQMELQKGQDAKDDFYWEYEIFHVGFVTPVLHYCMGGVAIDVDGRVLNKKRQSGKGVICRWRSHRRSAWQLTD